MPAFEKKKILVSSAWLLGLIVVLLAVAAWLQGLSGRLENLSIYQIFPLLGLIAFSLMWTHYFIGAVRQLLNVDKKALKQYFEVTSFIVLIAIVLHPVLLEYQLARDGFGLPPGSVLENYVAPAARWAAVIGMISWLIFLAYELRRKFGQKKWWKLVGYSQLIAMAAIFVHALKLGSHLQDWYLVIWWFFGISLMASVVYSELNKRRLVPSLKNRNNKDIGGAA